METTNQQLLKETNPIAYNMGMREQSIVSSQCIGVSTSTVYRGISDTDNDYSVATKIIHASKFIKEITLLCVDYGMAIIFVLI